jgi:hypothetical protein
MKFDKWPYAKRHWTEVLIMDWLILHFVIPLIASVFGAGVYFLIRLWWLK